MVKVDDITRTKNLAQIGRALSKVIWDAFHSLEIYVAE
jgi:hypothetical protein